jgi:hypothetical protein
MLLDPAGCLQGCLHRSGMDSRSSALHSCSNATPLLAPSTSACKKRNTPTQMTHNTSRFETSAPMMRGFNSLQGFAAMNQCQIQSTQDT